MTKGKKTVEYLQNRELSWLAFNERCLDQGSDKTVPLLERLKFISIFWSNLSEFFRVRVGSLTDLSLVKKAAVDSKTGMTPIEQIAAVHERCHELLPTYEAAFRAVEKKLAKEGVRHVAISELSADSLAFLDNYAAANIIPFLAPQVVTAHNPFPHLENGALYVVANLCANKSLSTDVHVGGKGVLLGIIPMPARTDRIVKIPGEGFNYVLLEELVEYITPRVFSMYSVRETAVICLTRNADLDLQEGVDEETDFREFMKKILKKRQRLAPVRLESSKPLSETVLNFLMEKIGVLPGQYYVVAVPLDMSYAYDLPDMLDASVASRLSYAPFTSRWPQGVSRNVPLVEQLKEHEIMCTYPYDTMDVFLQLIREAVADPDVVSIKITLYRLAKKSRLAELLIDAAEAGKEVDILFELRARFDEGNNIEWSHRCEKAGCHVSYGFLDYKVHSKLCLITRHTAGGYSYVTQIGTGNYNEKTAGLYTDVSLITSDENIGKDAVRFFKNVMLENLSNEYDALMVAPLQIKQHVCAKIDKQIALAKDGKPAGVFLKVNSVTDVDIINKLVEASGAGVPVTMLVRGICCLLPGVPGYTENIRVVSVVGRLLEHSRIYLFGPMEAENCELYISSADMMTRNLDRRVEVACPVLDVKLRESIINQMKLYLSDTVKLRELLPDGTYTPLPQDSKQAKALVDGDDQAVEEPAAESVEAQRVFIEKGVSYSYTMRAVPAAPAPQKFLLRIKAFFSRKK